MTMDELNPRNPVQATAQVCARMDVDAGLLHVAQAHIGKEETQSIVNTTVVETTNRQNIGHWVNHSRPDRAAAPAGSDW